MNSTTGWTHSGLSNDGDWKGICINAIYMKRNGNQRAKVNYINDAEQRTVGQSIKVIAICFTQPEPEQEEEEERRLTVEKRRRSSSSLLACFWSNGVVGIERLDLQMDGRE